MPVKILILGGSGFIGTHLCQKLIDLRFPILSADINPPKIEYHRNHWIHCDILSKATIETILRDFRPNYIFHLAAKANLNGNSYKDFPENILGVDNIVASANQCDSIHRVIFFSTQYVVKPGINPNTDAFLLPYTPYGESKAFGEKIVRSKCKKEWIILRPTNVWGPHHPFFPYELWKYLRLRLYLHPGHKPIIKFYSFIDNAINQIIDLGLSDSYCVNQRVFYITDPPIDNADWMNAFSLALNGRPIRRIPFKLWKLFAIFGDSINNVGLKFPMSSERLFRLTVNEKIPFQATIDLTGPPKTSLEEGVIKSIDWYKKSSIETKACSL